jgi:pSer/pThr/pTyr-binding forkhead associated (FHA) protein
VFAQLVPAEGGEPITIDKDVTIVGRQSDHCDIVLSRKSVSKIHCVIVKTDGLLFVRDLDSTNGTKVNGQRIVRGALLPGDQLAFAGEKFKVHLGPARQAPEASPIDRTEMIESFIDPSVAEDFGDGSLPSLLYKDPPARAAEDLVE